MSIDLTKAVSETLSSLINDENYQLPVFLVCIGINGNLVYVRYTAAGEICKCEMLAEYFEEHGLRCPIRQIFLDSATARLEMLTIDGLEERQRFPIQ